MGLLGLNSSLVFYLDAAVSSVESWLGIACVKGTSLLVKAWDIPLLSY